MAAKQSTFEKLQAAMIAGDKKAIDRLSKKFAEERNGKPAPPKKKAAGSLVLPGDDSPPPDPKAEPHWTPPPPDREVSEVRRKFVNRWRDDGEIQASGVGQTIDKANGHAKGDRPKGDFRRKQDLVDVRCDGCGKASKVYPGELSKQFNDNEGVQAAYRCNNCHLGKGRG